MYQSEYGVLEAGEDKGSDSELCPRALTKVLHIGWHGDKFFFQTFCVIQPIHFLMSTIVRVTKLNKDTLSLKKKKKLFIY
jgi:hypothetical protein